MINQTLFAAAVNEDKPILTGLLFDIEKTALRSWPRRLPYGRKETARYFGYQ